MRILQLRAARGWNLEQTARVFLVDLQTLQIWMRRLDEHGERDLIQTVDPVNRYPDFVRNLVRQLKRLFPTMGYERMATSAAEAERQPDTGPVKANDAGELLPGVVICGRCSVGFTTNLDRCGPMLYSFGGGPTGWQRFSLAGLEVPSGAIVRGVFFAARIAKELAKISKSFRHYLLCCARTG